VSRFVRTVGIAVGCLAVSAAGLSVVAGPAGAGVAVAPVTLTPVGGTANEGFGSAVAISGSTAVVGTTPGVGLAYVFVQSGGKWTQQAKLSNPGCGSSVAVSGPTVVVGGGCGTVYVYSESGGKLTQQAKLTGPEKGFGGFVALSGTTLAVVDNGAVDIFGESGGKWTEQANFPSSTHTPTVGISSLATTATTVVVSGTVGTRAVGSEVFFRSGGTWMAGPVLAPPIYQGGWGSSTAISGSTIVVGAKYAPPNLGRYRAGAAYVFVGSGNTWTDQRRLGPSPGSTEFFGQSAAVWGNTALIGAGDVAYVFVRSGTTWTKRTELTDSSAGNFAQALALSGSTAIVGAPYFGAGSADVFTQIP
jgi:hypothetical protein